MCDMMREEWSSDSIRPQAGLLSLQGLELGHITNFVKPGFPLCKMRLMHLLPIIASNTLSGTGNTSHPRGAYVLIKSNIITYVNNVVKYPRVWKF